MRRLRTALERGSCQTRQVGNGGIVIPRTMAEKMAVGVAANGTITIASEDTDIEWTVSSIIDDYAGVD